MDEISRPDPEPRLRLRRGDGRYYSVSREWIPGSRETASKPNLAPAPAYCLASGAARTWRQSGGSCDSVIGWLGWLFRRLRMNYRILEPVGEVRRAAAFAIWRRRLRHAFLRASGTGDADMEVIVMAVHRPDLGEPAAIAPGVAAQRFLDRGVDEMRSTRGSIAASRITARWPGVQTFGSTSSRSERTIMTADFSSRSSRDNRCPASASARRRRRARSDGWHAR